jgi:hypothetical protein
VIAIHSGQQDWAMQKFAADFLVLSATLDLAVGAI